MAVNSCKHPTRSKVFAQYSQAAPIKTTAWNDVLRTGAPLMLNMMILSASNLAEGLIGGRLGPDAQAGLGVGSQIWFVLMLLTLALSCGTNALVSRYWGAGDRQSAVEAAAQALLFACVFGVGSTALGLLIFPLLIKSSGASPMVARQACQYLQSTVLSMAPYTVMWIGNSIFRAHGDARTPMFVTAFITAAIVGMDYLFCLGPAHLGLAGIGLSWLLATAAGAAINWRLLAGGPLRGCTDLAACLRAGNCVFWLKRYLSIGLPACMQDLALLGASFGVFFLLSRLPDATNAQAAWAAGWRIEETVTIMPMYGLNIAAGALVGFNLGAARPHHAKRIGWLVAALGAAINILVATVLYAAAAQLAALFSADAAVQTACVDYLRSVCWAEPFFACFLILSGGMQGAGYTRWPMVATVLCFDGLRLLLAGGLCTGFGASARWVWLAMALSTLCAALLVIWKWQLGDWMRQRV